MDVDDDSSSASSEDASRISQRSPTDALPAFSTPKKDGCSLGNLSLFFSDQDSSDGDCSRKRRLSTSEVVSPSHSKRSKISDISNVSESDKDVSLSADPNSSVVNSSLIPISVDIDVLKPRKPLHTFSKAGLWKRLKRQEQEQEIFLRDVSSSSSSESPQTCHSLSEIEASFEPTSPVSFVEPQSASSYISNINQSFYFNAQEVDNAVHEESFANYSVIDYESESDESGDELDADIFELPENVALHSDADSAEDTESDLEDEEFFAYCEALNLDDRLARDKHAELKEFLRNWALKNGISLSSLSELCSGLKEVHPQCFADLQKDARTILHTPTEPLDISKVDPGEYLHHGIRKQINFIATLLTYAISVMPLLFNIDGVQLYKNSASTLWTILMTLPSIMELINKVFPIGLYFGKQKPKDVGTFLERFIDELLEIVQNGYIMNNVQGRVEILGFVCDVPARSFILGTVGHTGFFSCFRCTTRGQTVDKRRVFPQLDAPLREEAKFRAGR